MVFPCLKLEIYLQLKCDIKLTFHLKPCGGMKTVSENRIYDRIEYHMEFGCKNYYSPRGEACDLNNHVKFEIENLSMGGLLARSNVNLEHDSILEYTFYLESIPYCVMSRVRWKKCEADQYCYGMEFLTISNMLYRHLKAFTQRDSFIELYGTQDLNENV